MLYQRKRRDQKAALASALGEYFERLSTNYFLLISGLAKQSPTGHSCIIRMKSGFR